MEVRQQWKMQVAILGEGLVTPRAVYRNAQELSAMFAELGKDFVVEHHLVAADRTPVRRIESEDDRPSLQIAKGKPLVRRDPQLEVGSDCPGGKDLRHFSSPPSAMPAFGTVRQDPTYVALGSVALTVINLNQASAEQSLPLTRPKVPPT